MNKIPELKASVLEQAKSPELGQYVWKNGIGLQMGYAFSVIHALAYSFIGFQTAYLATRWNPIYWDTACLVVNSGSLETAEDDDNENKKESSTDYGKLAKALGDIIEQGIKVSLVDINRSSYGFKPDVENNQILFGMKALSNVGAPIIEKIIEGRPYKSLKDFMNRCPLSKTPMISLIKAGAFDNISAATAAELGVNPRIFSMVYYLSKVADKKNRLTLQNFKGLVDHDLIPDKLNLQKKVFVFNKYLKSHKDGNYYYFEEEYNNFYRENFNEDNLEIIRGVPHILQTVWDKNYKSIMEVAKDWLKENQSDLLERYNTLLFKETWDNYAKGTLSAWEMEALCFYYHEHELEGIDINKYGIVNFFDLPSEPIVERTFKRNGREIPLFALSRVAGTVISKNDSRSSITLLTKEGVVNVKFTKEYYAMFGRQISEVQSDGTKKVMEKGWFVRGTKLLVTGFRRDDTFVSKNYKSYGGHQLYKITKVDKNKNIELTHNRYGVYDEED